MSYQSAQCFFKFCDKCDSKGCACSCHENKEPVTIIDPPIRSKSTLKKRKQRLIEAMDNDEM
jgi:hypothetical protein